MSNSQRSARRLNLYSLATLGYAVVMMDTMGSCNRGIEFEAALQNNMVGYLLIITKSVITLLHFALKLLSFI